MSEADVGRWTLEHAGGSVVIDDDEAAALAWFERAHEVAKNGGRVELLEACPACWRYIPGPVRTPAPRRPCDCGTLPMYGPLERVGAHGLVPLARLGAIELNIDRDSGRRVSD